MQEALKEAKKAYKKGEIPVGAIIVKNNKIISKAHNLKEKNKYVTSHAEIIAIQKACKKLKNWRLIDCEIYVTLEPCLMCLGAILDSRIKSVTYGTSNPNFSTKKFCTENKLKLEICASAMQEQCSNIIKTFFSSKRK